MPANGRSFTMMMKSLAYWGKNKLVCVDVKNTFQAWKSHKRHQNISHVQMSHFYDFFTHKWSQFLLGLASKLSLRSIGFFVETFMMLKI